MAPMQLKGSKIPVRFFIPLFVLLFLSSKAFGAGSGTGQPSRDTEQVESAVEGALKWLSDNQELKGSDAGSWECREQRYRTGVAALAGLAFLADGCLPGEGEYGKVLDRAMDYVMASMTPDGYLGQGDPSGMYIHAITTSFGLSYLGMSPDRDKEKALADWCRRSLKLIVKAQRIRRPSVARGGWRYTPTSRESDVSVTSWQLLVLHSARQCGYEIPSDVLASGLRYINSAFTERKDEQSGEVTAGFVYRPGVSRKPEPSVTAVAVFIKSLNEGHEDEKIRRSLEFLKRFPPAWGGDQYKGYFFFASFYILQGRFQIGGRLGASIRRSSTRCCSRTRRVTAAGLFRLTIRLKAGLQEMLIPQRLEF